MFHAFLIAAVGILVALGMTAPGSDGGRTRPCGASPSPTAADRKRAPCSIGPREDSAPRASPSPTAADRKRAPCSIGPREDSALRASPSPTAADRKRAVLDRPAGGLGLAGLALPYRRGPKARRARSDRGRTRPCGPRPPLPPRTESARRARSDRRRTRP
ncbi:MAG: hypothetical protein MZV70_00215 [Desulfobacterales bacterium]|nr:hypothetical protein [Desulfobacterales bacterium]